MTAAAKARAKKKRATVVRQKLLLGIDERGGAVPAIRVRNRTAAPATWADPDDLSVTRRTAKQVSNFRAVDPVSHLVETGTISRRQCKAAVMFRNQFEKAEYGLGKSIDLGAIRGGFVSGPGASEIRLMAIDALRQTRKVVGPPWPILVEIVVEGATLKAYAERHGQNRGMVAGRFVAALDVAYEHYFREQPEHQQH